MNRRAGKILAAALALALMLAAPLAARAQEPETVTVFAAASTTNALTDIGKLFEAQGKGKVVSSFASSSTLAKQIENGAPAQVFVSADLKWMDYLAERKLIEPGTRQDLLHNTLVLIAPADSKVSGEVKAGMPLMAWLGDGRLSTGDPDHVPAGIYAKQALTKLGLWEQVEPKLARAADVRAALALVERGETPLGIVYATDAAVSGKVKIIGAFPEGSHPPIVYPVCLVAGKASPAAAEFLKFMASPPAVEVFKKYGFDVK